MGVTTSNAAGALIRSVSMLFTARCNDTAAASPGFSSQQLRVWII